MKKALITGITGQDGAYLAELLLRKGYEVWGLRRRRSGDDYGHIGHLLGQIHLLCGDMTDPVSLLEAVRKAQPDEVYNLAAQSFVAASWDAPLSTASINGFGVAALLEAIRIAKPDARFYQASTSELFGKVQEMPQTERTPFYPRSPYGVAKLYGHYITRNYRESYGLYACAGILFNHESERRGPEFVTRKITRAAAAIRLGQQERLVLGNLDARRDWGHSEDYVRAMWLMLQQEKPEDYVIASGETRTVREFADAAFAAAGIPLIWEGEGLREVGKLRSSGKIAVMVSKDYFRPAEVDVLLGDPSRAEKQLGWRREISFETLVGRMVAHDLALLAA
ncbi:MAG: GDP-mannose 4,6-dehydratase [Oscillospiraceae bacterium]|nr:GDP-mannose 4,6-dehydratase [Oscillospiraceae bacterium]